MQNILPVDGICTAFILPAVLFLVVVFLHVWFHHGDIREGGELLMNSFKLRSVDKKWASVVLHRSITITTAEKNSRTEKSKKRWEPESNFCVSKTEGMQHKVLK